MDPAKVEMTVTFDDESVVKMSVSVEDLQNLQMFHDVNIFEMMYEQALEEKSK